MERRLTAVYVNTGDWWVGTVAEVPGAISQEPTLQEARDSLIEAVQRMLEVKRVYTEHEIGDAEFVRERLTIPLVG